VSKVAINPSARAQKIDGFGASNVWAGPLDAAQADLFFSTSGIGLTIFRLGIGDTDSGIDTPFLDSDPGVNSSILDAKRALTLNPDVKVIATPWSPNAAYKSTGSINSGSLLVAKYQNWASYVGSAVDYATSQGVPVYAVGMQNEPDYDTSGAYAMCLFTPAETRDFIKVLGPVLASRSPAPRLIAPEPAAWSRMWAHGSGYVDTIAADSTALSYVGIWGTHQYGMPIGSVSAPGDQHGRPIWVTEASDNIKRDNSIAHGLKIARWIHHAIVEGNASAWLYWWLIPPSDNTEGLLGPDGVTQSKRLWVLGNFSRFVRPGFVRYGHTGTLDKDVLVSFYRDPGSNRAVAVAINSGSSPTTLILSFSGTSASEILRPWVTDQSRDLAPQSPVQGIQGEFTCTLPASSVTTFVADDTHAP
jgi:glucuronoarabinoxylan endo-1,4-beta-xylanase